MLNISENSIRDRVRVRDFRAHTLLQDHLPKRILRIALTTLICALIVLFLPWTQNINSKGFVTTRSPEQRPQAIQSVITGKLEKWYVREGDFVNKGDTIVFISETKTEYFDPNLVARTSEQMTAKAESIDAYEGKAGALQDQFAALQAARELKLAQTRNKIDQSLLEIETDSVNLVAEEAQLNIAQNQYDRINQLYEEGLKSLSELQEKFNKLQEAQAKVQAKRNKLLYRRQELANYRIDLNAIEREYADKLAKSRSDLQSARVDQLNAVAATSKLQTDLASYTLRQQLYYITAPQAGYVTKTLKKGLGEIIKEGTDIATIMPAEYDLAVEAYVEPLDLPLIRIGEQVRMRFDGWPAIVISGWPQASTGIFSGTVVAIDQFTNDKGKYRILVSPDDEEKAWPELLRVGAGVQTFVMLNDVPIWYELWRQLNGFPPDFYQEEAPKEEDVKLKAPIKSVK